MIRQILAPGDNIPGAKHERSIRMRYILSVMLVLGLLGFSNADEKKVEEKKIKDTVKESSEEMENPLVLMQTNYGDIIIEVFEKDMPVHGGNFLKLVDEGFYDSLTFHRVVKDFVIQGGDPEGTGMGGAPGRLADEESPYKHDRGTIAMARGHEASTSQFYINLKGNYRLDSMGFSVFAKVVEGMDVVDKISMVETAFSGREKSTPVEPVIMTKVTRKISE